MATAAQYNKAAVHDIEHLLIDGWKCSGPGCYKCMDVRKKNLTHGQFEDITVCIREDSHGCVALSWAYCPDAAFTQSMQ